MKISLLKDSAYSEILVCIIQRLDQSISDGESCSLESAKVVKIESSQTQSVLNMIHYGSLD